MKNMSDNKKEIIKMIHSISGGYSVYSVFQDWVEMLAMAFSNAVDKINYEKRDKRYLQLQLKYTKEQLKKMAQMTAMLVEAFEEKTEDVLGYIYMHLEISSSRLSQFFTPYHLSKLMASFSETTTDDNGHIKIIEPSCGSGGNIIALAEHLKTNNINYQNVLFVKCKDLDWNCVYMCYVQICLLGIPGTVEQCNTLENSYVTHDKRFITPQFLLKGGV